MKEMGTPVLWAGIGGGRADREWWRPHIQKAHAQNTKVLGQFSMGLVYGDAATGRGWFAYFDKYWDEALLGPKPRRADGTPLTAIELMQHTGPQRTVESLVRWQDYKVEGGSEYKGCPSNPYWRETLKRFVKAGIDLGLDGFNIVFPHKENCTCEYCQAGFKKHLSERYTPAEIQAQFGIADLAAHRFDTINGWYEPEEASPLRLESLKFSQLLLRDCLREVFLDYGRKLKPDLIVGQWNHMYRSSMSGPGQIPGTFAVLNADERGVLPTELWAKDENFVWYSIGAAHLYYKPEAGDLAQFSLELKYLREAGRGLPQAVKQDDSLSVRRYISEAVAHGGFAYARGPNYKDPATQEIVKTYFDFLRRYENLYRPIQSYADVALIYPRSAIRRGDKSAILDFKNIGYMLTRWHVSFDVVVDEMMPLERRKQYRVIVQPQSGKLTPEDAAPLQALRKESVIDASSEVVSVVWRQAQQRRLLLHLVNYKRDNTPVQPPLQGAAAERPLPQENIKVHLRLPSRSSVRRITLLSPEAPEPQPVAFKTKGDTVNFTVDKMLVYAVLNIELK
ncbi:MAG TPA: hypothetical protein VNA16_10930, partial [Abditibacteriaceae bacterium]|nr:hypothetical protein [Abditibacteriaceae bacterium]